jgi:hypothetical protein
VPGITRPHIAALAEYPQYYTSSAQFCSLLALKAQPHAAQAQPQATQTAKCSF